MHTHTQYTDTDIQTHTYVYYTRTTYTPFNDIYAISAGCESITERETEAIFRDTDTMCSTFPLVTCAS